MTDLLERTPVRDEVLDERKPEPLVKPPREERGIEMPTAKRPVRWIRWMIGALVMVVVATALVVALNDDGTTAVLDTDGSFQVVEAQRMEALLPPAVLDGDGSFQVVEAQRMKALTPTVVDSDGSFQAVEAQRMDSLKPGS